MNGSFCCSNSFRHRISRQSRFVWSINGARAPCLENEEIMLYGKPPALPFGVSYNTVPCDMVRLLLRSRFETGEEVRDCPSTVPNSVDMGVSGGHGGALRFSDVSSLQRCFDIKQNATTPFVLARDHKLSFELVSCFRCGLRKPFTAGKWQW